MIDHKYQALIDKIQDIVDEALDGQREMDDALYEVRGSIEEFMDEKNEQDGTD